MDWLDAMNKAVEYLEANITEKLDIEKVAKITLSSSFHFQRMYHTIQHHRRLLECLFS
ncbi:hypothetical protein DEAC_c44510 [Desulfosporosinus acididurans]|uniref:Uncharacterized protein n=1 Tax=Desulfosporosinus acididurans TaxID=476652 RepID=A0A0J1FJJ6_9FIRM|nr:hypothetical protein DEAC_c44510 [Desulfosporosinus acididurans]